MAALVAVSVFRDGLAGDFVHTASWYAATFALAFIAYLVLCWLTPINAEAFGLQNVALEAAANGIVITDRNGVIVWANPAFERMTGWPVAEVIGRTPSLLKSGMQDKAFYASLWGTIRRGEIWHGTLINRRKDGTTYFEEMTITPVRNKLGQISHFIAIKQDITARKEAEDAMAAARNAAEQANKAKDHFLAVLSHELRTPLSAVIPALEELRARISGENTELLDMALRNVELEARLIDDLLDVTRIARGKTELDRRVVDLATIVHQAAEVCQPDIAISGIHFKLTSSTSPLPVHADAARLQQVFWNLIKNSVKFTPRGGCVGVQVRRDGQWVIIDVSDSGAGIEPDSISRIFDAFEQETRMTTRQFGGLGLGLAITRALVELHGGRIQAHSEGKGKGSRFRVELPLAQLKHIPARSPRSTHGASANGIKPLRILLVEDHADTARIFSRLLRGRGHDVTHAADVASALDTVTRGRFDLLVSDLGLPDRTGHELMRELRARGSNLPAIAVSGFGMPTDVKQSLDSGFVEHVTKPVNFRLLEEAIVRAVRPGAVA